MIAGVFEDEDIRYREKMVGNISIKIRLNSMV